MNDRIEKTIELRAPVARVWRALTDHRQFGEWFRARIDQPFAADRSVTAQMTHPGLEDVHWTAEVTAMEPERRFAWRWHPGACKPDDPDEPMTTVEFRLEPTEEGTRLTIVESGFASLPASRRDTAMRENTNGWNIQANNLAEYVAA